MKWDRRAPYDVVAAGRFAKLATALALIPPLGVLAYVAATEMGWKYWFLGISEFFLRNYAGPNTTGLELWIIQAGHALLFLLAMAFNGMIGVGLSVGIVVMWSLDWLWAPAGCFEKLTDINKDDAKAMRRYMTGFMAICGLGFWLIFLAPGDILIQTGGKIDLLGAWVSWVLLSGMLFLFVAGVLSGRIYSIQKTETMAGRVFAGLLGRLVWRSVFWIFLVPCFVGFVRLVVESLLGVG